MEHNGFIFNILTIIVPWLSILATTMTTLSFLWVTRHYDRYNIGINITSGVLTGTVWWNSVHLSFPTAEAMMHSRLYTHHIWYDISFILIALMIVKCGIKESYMREIICKK